MGAKKIIIPIAIAAVVACGVGYYCYSTVKATTVSESTTASSSSLGNNETLSSNANVSGSTTNNEISSQTASKVNSTTATNVNTNSTEKIVSNNITSTGATNNNTKSTGSVGEETSGTETSSSNNSNSTSTTTRTSSDTGISSSNSSSQRLINLKETCLNQINEINNTVNEMTEKVKDENPTQYQVDGLEGNIYETWQGEVNTIYSQLQEVISSNAFSKLQQDQESWIKTANTKALDYAKSYAGGGSDYTAVLYMKLGEYYKARCYYLVDNYM